MAVAQTKKKVCYYYDDEIGNFYYGAQHPMKPHRIRMTHTLLLCYDLYKKLEIYRPYALSEADMTNFHADDYVNFLHQVTPENEHKFQTCQDKYNIDVDCPVFEGLFRFCQLTSGGSVGSAYRLNHGMADICVNWSGGLHHAKKSEASGFCYVNDIVLAILELLKFAQRVLYIDIDIHHGDGVEEAFYCTDRVMTVSFHKYGEFFPGTGDVNDIGAGPGVPYSINFPLDDGMNDEAYQSVFKPIISKVMESYQPGAIVLQCGADSLTDDRLGCFNLTLDGHGECVKYVKSFNIPLLVLGGGGYTIRNVARCWTNETAICLDTEISNDIPHNEYYEYFFPDFKLNIPPSNRENKNTRQSLEKTKNTILEILRDLPNSPSVQFHDADRSMHVQPEEKEPDPDARVSVEDRAQKDTEFFDGEKDQDAQAVAPEYSRPKVAPHPPISQAPASNVQLPGEAGASVS